jgi:hypothetical protein
VPGALMERNELQNFPVPPNQYVSRYLKTANLAEIRMCCRIKAIGEQFFDMGAAELPWGKTDAMNDDQVGLDATGPCVLVW